MKYLADEMIEDLAKLLRDKGIDCRTVHEWIDGNKIKNRDINDDEIRAFIQSRKMEGVEITLVTSDRKSRTKSEKLGLQVLYVPEIIREYILRQDTLVG